MIVRRRAVVVILLYIALDLSIAAMPGAFVFEPGESVESVQMSRVRPLLELAAESAPVRDHNVVVVEAEVKQRPLPKPALWKSIRSGDGRIQTSEPSTVSEDPH